MRNFRIGRAQPSGWIGYRQRSGCPTSACTTESTIHHRHRRRQGRSTVLIALVRFRLFPLRRTCATHRKFTATAPENGIWHESFQTLWHNECQEFYASSGLFDFIKYIFSLWLSAETVFRWPCSSGAWIRQSGVEYRGRVYSEQTIRCCSVVPQFIQGLKWYGRSPPSSLLWSNQTLKSTVESDSVGWSQHLAAEGITKL